MRLRSSAQHHRTDALIPAALAGAAFLVAWGALHWGFYARDPLRDTPLYEHYGDLILRGHVPYRDFRVEYPPAALPVFVLPALVAGHRHYAAYSQVFEGLMGVFGIACAALVAFVLTRLNASPRRLWLGVGLAALGPLALGPVLLSRFDLWPAALTVAALAALAVARPRLGLALLGLAVAAKLYPVVLVPLALLYVARRHGAREARIAGAVSLAVAAAIFLPFVALSPSGMRASFEWQLGRPLQIESLGASVLTTLHGIIDFPLFKNVSHGSNNFVGTAAHGLALEQSVLQVLAIVLIWIWFARGDRSVERLLTSSAAAVCAFIALGKVLSPQYLAWLLPLVPLVRGRRGVGAGALLLLAMALTQAWFPYRYLELVATSDPLTVSLVLARDLVLIALLAVLVWPSARES